MRALPRLIATCLCTALAACGQAPAGDPAPLAVAPAPAPRIKSQMYWVTDDQELIVVDVPDALVPGLMDRCLIFVNRDLRAMRMTCLDNGPTASD